MHRMRAQLEQQVCYVSTENEKENDEDNTEQLLDNYNTENVDAHDYSGVNHVIFACDAGMGSSAMGKYAT